MTRKIRVNKAQSASSQETNPHASGHHHSAQEVADAFVRQYYYILRRFPEITYKFYKDESILSRPGDDGMRSVTMMKEIDEEIMRSDNKNTTITLLNVHAQDTVAESVIVGVIGLLSKDNMLKCFSQTFLLAPQARGFYVHNDFFQFIDSSYLNTPNDTAAYHLVSMKDKGTSTEEHIDAINQISANSSDTKNSVFPDEPNKIKAPPIAKSFSNTQEDVKKLSYASIVTKANSLPSTNATVEVSPKIDMQSWAPPKNDTAIEAAPEALEKDQNHKPSSTKEVTDIEKNSPLNAEEVEKKESYASIVTKIISLPVPPPASGQVLGDKSSTVVPATTQSAAPRIVKTIVVKDLPPQVTRRSITHAVKGFGPVKHRNIQIRGYGDGYRYAFVQFNQQNAAHLAVQAGSIKFDDWECQVESKKAHVEGVEGSDGSGSGGGNDSRSGGDYGNGSIGGGGNGSSNLFV